MKIIDNKGRIFGKINIIDFGVLLFVLFLLPMFYFGGKIFCYPPPDKPKTIVTAAPTEAESFEAAVQAKLRQLRINKEVLRRFKKEN